MNTDYVPMFIKQRIHDLSMQIKIEAGKNNLPYTVAEIQDDYFYPPKSFNLASALHHACGTASFIYESNQGINYARQLADWETQLSYEEILHEHYILFEQTIRFASATE